ncbi:MAG: microcin ABC transporter permease, partial [Pseudomonadota bacterium]
MAAYIVRRLLLMIPTIFGIMLVTFAVTQFVPGGPVERMLAQLHGHDRAGGEVRASRSMDLYQGDKGLDEERVAQLTKLYGFDKPPVERFLTMMKNYSVFDFGTSYYHHNSVAALVISKLPVSMSLGLWSFLLVYGVCIPLGIAKAMR